MSPRRFALRLGLPVAAALAAGAALLADRIVGAERARIVSPEGAPDAPVAIVLGAGVWAGGTPSAVLEDRLRTACDLYRAGKARALLVSGDHGRAGYDEPGAMARYAEERGVPPEAIFLDHAGFDTYATIYRARRVFQVERALVVTQDFHLPRALFLARRLGIEATGVRADRRRYPARSWYAAREVAARLKALIWTILEPKPRFLGPPIPIAGGDGRVTRDPGQTHKPAPPPPPR